jgi:hypothetical protein
MQYTGTGLVQAGGGTNGGEVKVRSANLDIDGGSLELRAGTAGAGNSANVSFRATGDIDVDLTSSFVLRGGTATGDLAQAGVEMNGTNSNYNVGGSMLLSAGTANSTGQVSQAAVVLQSTGDKDLTVGGDLYLLGGTALGGKGVALAQIDPTTMDLNVGGNLVLVGGAAAGGDASATIVNTGEIKINVGGGGAVTLPGLGTFSPGLVMVGGNGSGLFDNNSVKLDGSFFPITVRFASGGGQITTAFSSLLSDAYIQSLQTRNVNSNLLDFVINSLNQSLLTVKFRVKENEEDRKEAEKCR